MAILQADARIAAQLTAALSGDHEVVVRSDWGELHGTLSTKRFGGCLVDGDHPDRETAVRAIKDLRARYPHLAIVACIESTYGSGYYDFGELGVSGILVCGPQPPTRIRAVVDGALAAARAECIASTLQGRFAQPGPDAIAWAVEHAGAETNVGKLAAAVGHTPKSLRQALQEAGLPAPTRVLLWGRLLLAAARLGLDGRRVEDVAYSLGYSTATSLSRAMKSQTGLTPAQLSERGGMERVRDALFPKQGGSRPNRGHLGKIAALALLPAMAGCAGLGIGGSGVDRGAIDDLLDSSPIDQAHVGVLAVDARTGRTLYSRNAHQWFVPASNQKILLTAAAWSLLGPDYRFRTEVWATAPLTGEHLDGDLVLIGSGDPTLSARYWDSGVGALDALVDSIGAAGPAHVMGSLFVDVSAWDSATVGPTWEVEDLRYAYGSTGGAFAIDEGEVEVVVRAGSTVGAPATVEWFPVGTDDFVSSHVLTSPADSSTTIVPHYLPETRQLVLEGVAELGTVDTLVFAQRDPVGQAVTALERAIDRAGIFLQDGWQMRWSAGEAVGGGCVAGLIRECAGANLVARIESPPLSDIIADVLGPSQNWIAEQLVRTLGAEYGDRGSWPEGLAVVGAFLADEVGVDSLDVSARDGSGRSAYNLLTPRALVRVLQYMDARPDAAAYRAAMAEPGEEGSTLEQRLAGLEGRVFAKTGSISNVSALSGYLVRQDGGEVIFSILSNTAGLQPPDVRATIDEIVRVLAR